MGGRRPLETTRAGVFAIGDVRAGSIKRLAAAVGEGAQVIASLHSFLGMAQGRTSVPDNRWSASATAASPSDHISPPRSP
jgi:thioredoxin reductase (NADPH)